MMIFKSLLFVIFITYGGTHNNDPSPKVESIKMEMIVMQNQLLNITLASESTLGFDLMNNEGKVIFFWRERQIPEGTHLLSLPMPDLEEGKYFLRVLAGDEEYLHLLVKRNEKSILD